MQLENVHDIESSQRDSLQHHELQMLHEFRISDHADQSPRAVRSVAPHAIDEHSVQPASRKDSSHDRDVSAMRADERRIIKADDMGEPHFTFVPAGTLASTLSSDGSPPIEAASTMPFDSMPISFAGWSLATITTWRTTSASGDASGPIPATSVR